MKALQVHYTSCRRGRSGGAGFQIHSASAGLDSGEARLVERRGGYRPPRGLPPEPSDEVIARDFPVAFRSYRLESGRHALTLSSYSGRDYSSRWGNYFAHSLLFDPPANPAAARDRWPIDYYEWDGWRRCLEDEGEPAAAAIRPLPEVDLAPVAPAESFSLKNLSAFLDEDPARVGLLARMGRAVLAGRRDRRPLVVRGDPFEVTYWVACVSKLFPPHHAWEISLSTYEDDPRNAAAITGTTEGTSFTFQPTERDYQFYMFDPVAGIASEVPEIDDDYPARAARWMAADPRLLDTFFSALHRFEPFPLEPDTLLDAAILLSFLATDAPRPDRRELAGVLRFADRYLHEEGRGWLAERLATIASAPEFPPELVGEGGMLRFVVEAAERSGDPEQRQQAYESWLSWLESGLAEPEPPLQALQEGWRDLLRLPQRHRSDLAQQFLSGARRARRAAYLPQVTPEVLGWLLERTLESLEMSLPGAEPGEREEVRELLQIVLRSPELEPAMARVLRAASGDGARIAGLCLRMRELAAASGEPFIQVADAALAGALGEMLGRESPAVARAVRERLAATDASDLLIGEWRYLLGRSSDPVTTFETYEREALVSLPQLRVAVVTSFLDALGEPKGSRWAAERLLQGRLGDFGCSEVRERMIRLANRAISLREEDAEEAHRLADRVQSAAQIANLRLEPHMPELLGVLTALRVEGERPKGISEASLQASLCGADASTYGFFVRDFLAVDLETAGDGTTHVESLLRVYDGGHPQVFLGAYEEFFAKRRSKREVAPLKAAVEVWLLDAVRRERLQRLAAIKPTAAERTRRAVLALGPASFVALCRLLDQEGRVSPDSWLVLREDLELERKSVKQRVGRRLGRAAGKLWLKLRP